MVWNTGLKLWRKLPSKDPGKYRYVCSHTWGPRGIFLSPSVTFAPSSPTEEKRKGTTPAFIFIYFQITSEQPCSSWKHLEIVHVLIVFDPFFPFFFFFFSLKPAWKTKGRLPISLTVNKKESKHTHTHKPQRNVFKMQTVVRSTFVSSIRQERSGAELSGLSC